MAVRHTRLNKEIRLTRPQRLFAQDRETVEEAYGGDIIGLTNPGLYSLGDTVCVGSPIHFKELPPFAPEMFAVLTNRSIERFKHFEKGIEQLCDEGLVDLFLDVRAHRRDPILGVVGKLQFEVIQYRLKSEYGVDTLLEGLSFDLIRYIDADPKVLAEVYWGSNARPVQTRRGNTAVLVAGTWPLKYLEDKNPLVRFYEREDMLKGYAPTA